MWFKREHPILSHVRSKGEKIWCYNVFPWCPPMGKEASGTNWNVEVPFQHQETHFYCEDDKVLEQVAWKDCGVSIPGDIQKLLWHFWASYSRWPCLSTVLGHYELHWSLQSSGVFCDSETLLHTLGRLYSISGWLPPIEHYLLRSSAYTAQESLSFLQRKCLKLWKAIHYSLSYCAISFSLFLFEMKEQKVSGLKVLMQESRHHK